MVFGISCRPYLLNASLQDHLDKYLMFHLEVVDKITSSLYVDDVVMGTRYEEATYKLYLRIWNSNSSGILENMKEY